MYYFLFDFIYVIIILDEIFYSSFKKMYTYVNVINTCEKL